MSGSEEPGPISRPVLIGRIGDVWVDGSVEADPAERAALAATLDVPSVRMLSAKFRFRRQHELIRVEGRIRASLEQTCVVTLEPFPVTVDEPVRVDFATPDPRRPEPDPDVWLSPEDDPPDVIEGDHIDLGAIAVEFLALALDPYPKKPGATFADASGEEPASPFAALARLKRDEP